MCRFRDKRKHAQAGFDKAKIASIIRIFRDKRKHAQASWHFDKANIASHFAHS